ncbi:MAG TPA: ABC transporter permease, partial [Chryseosolibacter sp.]|nr:ABC transporter permease [Chryseosolibacter sp.]
MLKLHLILALRNLLKRRFYASIEIAGLAIGLACLVVILLHFRKETSYDKFVTDYKKIFRVLNLESGTGNRYSGGASALGLHARTEVPGITELVRVFFPYRMFSTSALISIDDRRFYEDNIIEADSNFFRMFDFTLLEGYAGSALRHPNSVVISERVAIRLFGRQPALGKTLQIDGGELQVSGVARVPQNTHLAFDFLRPAHHNPGQLNVWEHTLAFTYLKVRDPELVPEIERQLHDIILKNATTENTDYLKSYFQILQPLAEIHNTVIQWDIVKPVSRMQLWSILGLAVFILLLAVTNFVNLTTARAGERMKETGISKILGASRRRLTMQFFAEFFIASVLAGALALIFLPWLTKVFNAAMNTSLDSREIMELPMILLFIFTLIVTAVLSGVYPAAKLSRFRPTDVFKRATSTGRPQHRLRSILVVFQFVISIGLLSGTFIVRNQVQFLQKADLGFNKEHVYIVRFRQADPARFERLKNLL